MFHDPDMRHGLHGVPNTGLTLTFTRIVHPTRQEPMIAIKGGRQQHGARRWNCAPDLHPNEGRPASTPVSTDLPPSQENHMFIVTEAGTISEAARGEIARLRALADDLERIAAGDLPTQDTLAGAPVIENYRRGIREVPVLVGDVEGHPRLGTTLTTTTTLWAFAPTHGWARTQSRFYRLLNRASQDSQ